jgi:hypothetical protein
MEGWFVDPILAAFAVRVVEKAEPHAPKRAREALQRATQVAAGPAAADAAAALKRLGVVDAAWPRLPAVARSVRFVGDGPWLAVELREAFPSKELDSSESTDGFVDTIVVGRDAELDWADRALILQTPRPARFVPQEAWIALLLFDADWWLDDPAQLNVIIDNHPPLQAVRALWPSGPAWHWPSTEPPGTGGGEPGNLEAQSPLFRLGYNVSELNEDGRWQVLSRTAVPLLGLRAVAEHIAFLVKLRKLQHNGAYRYRYAIGEWEKDLAKLRDAYYRLERPSFPWPQTQD